ILLGFLGLLYRKFFRNGAANSPAFTPRSTSAVENSGNTTFTANPTINVYTASDLADSDLAESASPASRAQDKPTVPDPDPFIERLDIRFATIHRTPGRRYKWIENEGGAAAIIIEFRNRHAQTGHKAATAQNVVARLIFTPKNAKSVINNAACWL